MPHAVGDQVGDPVQPVLAAPGSASVSRRRRRSLRLSLSLRSGIGPSGGSGGAGPCVVRRSLDRIGAEVETVWWAAAGGRARIGVVADATVVQGECSESLRKGKRDGGCAGSGWGRWWVIGVAIWLVAALGLRMIEPLGLSGRRHAGGRIPAGGSRCWPITLWVASEADRLFAGRGVRGGVGA